MSQLIQEEEDERETCNVQISENTTEEDVLANIAEDANTLLKFGALKENKAKEDEDVPQLDAAQVEDREVMDIFQKEDVQKQTVKEFKNNSAKGCLVLIQMKM